MGGFAFRLRLHPFFADALLTGLTQALILVANLWLVNLVSRWMGVAALGEYLLLKRVSAWLLTGTQLGLGVALPREIARASVEGAERGRQCFAAAFLVLIPALAVVSIAGGAAAAPLVRLCFGSRNQQLVFALLCLLAGSALQTMVFGYYRGLQKMRFGNLVQLGGLVAIPLLSIALLRGSLSAALLVEVTGAIMAAASVLWALPILFRAFAAGWTILADAKRLLGYGMARVPADLAIGALLALGPMLVAHAAGMAQVSYFLLGVTALTMICLAFWPVVMMLLAKISSHLAWGRAAEVIEYVQHLRSAVVQLSLLAMTQGIIFAAPLMRWWLGDSYLVGIPVICALLAATPAYLYYYSMRSVLDAASNTPYNTYNLLLALGAFVIGSSALLGFGSGQWITLGIPVMLTISLYLLAFATDRSLHCVELVRHTPSWKSLWIVAVLGAISLSVQWTCRFQTSRPVLVAVLVFNAVAGILLLRRSKPEWVEFLGRIAFSRA
jgi:O-antigen/teichoic acid export membrane protein